MKILYMDKDILVADKEAGLAVQNRNALTMDLEGMLLAALSEKEPDGRKPELHIINRLDQPVEGLVLFARNKKSAADLSRQLQEGRIEKYYRAEVTGPVPKEEDTLTDYLIRDIRSNTCRVVPAGTPNAKKAVLAYRKISDRELEITLMTGRHHQIRVQLAHAGMPIRGDRKYGFPEPSYHGRLMLTACRLAFIHPGTGRRVEFSSRRKS